MHARAHINYIVTAHTIQLMPVQVLCPGVRLPAIFVRTMILLVAILYHLPLLFGLRIDIPIDLPRSIVVLVYHALGPDLRRWSCYASSRPNGHPGQHSHSIGVGIA